MFLPSSFLLYLRKMHSCQETSRMCRTLSKYFLKLSMKLFKTKNCNNLKFKLINFKEFKKSMVRGLCVTVICCWNREKWVKRYFYRFVHCPVGACEDSVVAWHPPILFRSRNHSSGSLLSNAPFLANFILLIMRKS